MLVVEVCQVGQQRVPELIHGGKVAVSPFGAERGSSNKKQSAYLHTSPWLASSGVTGFSDAEPGDLPNGSTQRGRTLLAADRGLGIDVLAGFRHKPRRKKSS